MVQFNPIISSDLLVSRQPPENRFAIKEQNPTAPSQDPANQSTDTRQARTTRVPTELIIQTLPNQARDSRFSRASSYQPPIAQYQNNAQLLKREELDSLIGIDLFA